MSGTVHGVTPKQTITFTVNGSRVTNVKAAVIYRIYVSVYFKDIYFSFSTFLLVTIPNMNVSTNCALVLCELR